MLLKMLLFVRQWTQHVTSTKVVMNNAKKRQRIVTVYDFLFEAIDSVSCGVKAKSGGTSS